MKNRPALWRLACTAAPFSQTRSNPFSDEGGFPPYTPSTSASDSAASTIANFSRKSAGVSVPREGEAFTCTRRGRSHSMIMAP